MVMAAPIPMPTDAQILTLSQWFSPTYPIGAFAYSHGLEWAIETGEVHDAASLGAWVSDVLEHGSGQADALFLTAAYNAPDAKSLRQIDDSARAFCPSGERLKETDLQGAAFCAITHDVWHAELKGLTYAVAVGHAVKVLELPLLLATQMYLQAFLSNLVSVGMRLVPLGQTQGHRLIRSMSPLCSRIASDALNGTLDDLSSTAFLADIASMKHETQYSRIFRT